MGHLMHMRFGWDKVTLGRTGLSVTPIGLGSSYGLSAKDVERAFDRGINYMYWGSFRKDDFGRGLRRVAARRREDLVLVIQSYTRVASLMRPSLEKALRALGTGYTDLLVLGWWNDLPPPRILDAARHLVDQGKVRHIMISCHHRPSFVKYMAEPIFGALMVRYNAAHTGAEKEVFPHLPSDRQKRPGVVAYTATRWGQLLSPKLVPPGEERPRGSDCYRFVLSHPEVNVVLAGPKDGLELDEALAALDRGPMSEEELAWMRRVGRFVHDAPAQRKIPGPAELFARVTRALSGP